nr:sigma-70 family RNA polymerase sigma factor [Desertibacillus haloalkaliphilus]
MKNGSEHAFQILIEKYRDYIFRSVYSVLRNQKDAEDAAQGVFVRMYYSLPRYQGQGFKTWMTRLAVNHAIDMKRKAGKQKEAAIEVETTANDNVEEEMIVKERRELVCKHLEDVPSNYRDVIEQYYLREKSYQEIAREQKVTVKTVETKLYRARAWLKKHWKEEDFR